MRIVPTFDECEHSLACLWLVVEGRAIEQFAFQGGEETLAEGIIETISDKAHGRVDAGISTALAKSQGSVLAALIGVMDDIFWVTLPGVVGSFDPVITISSIWYVPSSSSAPAASVPATKTSAGITNSSNLAILPSWQRVAEPRPGRGPTRERQHGVPGPAGPRAADRPNIACVTRPVTACHPAAVRPLVRI